VTVDKLRAHAYINAATWYDFANHRRGRMAPNGALHLVTGCDKAKSWALGSFTETAKTNLAGRAGNMSYFMQSDYYDSPQIRYGPVEPSDTENQCIFLRALAIFSGEHSGAQEDTDMVRGKKRRSIFYKTIWGSGRPNDQTLCKVSKSSPDLSMSHNNQKHRT
jgi:hypothetical protein